jgi:FAD/FMN-containing dehydrogenase
MVMFVDDLRVLLGESGVRAAPDDLQAFTEDWRGRYRGPAACVALPISTEQVAATVRLCAEAGATVLPQGGNTSLCGGAVPAAEGTPPVIINLQRMRRIRSLDLSSNVICVDAGCVLEFVQRTAVENGRLFPVSLGAEGSCQIGGAIATNAGGTGVLRYGNMRDNVLGLEVVLPDGTIWDGLYALRKNNTGYDLKHLFIGSEGTLGVVTGATLKLHPLPTARSVAWLRVADLSSALEFLGLMRATCDMRLTAFELINGNQVALVTENIPGRRCPVADATGWHVLVELSDTGSAASLDELLQTVLESAYERQLILDAVPGASEAQRASMWEFRHSVSEANKKGGVGLTTDCAVPLSAVPEFVDRATKAVRAIVAELPVLVVAHLGDGNVHFIPFFSFAEWQAVPDKDALARRIRAAINNVSIDLWGTFSAEHGVGQSLLAEMARYKPAAEIAMMRSIKHAFDPGNRFNPGRLLPPAGSGVSTSKER